MNHHQHRARERAIKCDTHTMYFQHVNYHYKVMLCNALHTFPVDITSSLFRDIGSHVK